MGAHIPKSHSWDCSVALMARQIWRRAMHGLTSICGSSAFIGRELCVKLGGVDSAAWDAINRDQQRQRQKGWQKHLNENLEGGHKRKFESEGSLAWLLRWRPLRKPF